MAFGQINTSMRNLWLLITLALLGCSSETTIQAESEPDTRTAVECVNPFIGTGGHGHTFPGATMPFGMVQLSPDTRLEGWDGCSGYHYTDSVVYGFSQTHLSGTGVSDYGDVLFMPTTGEIDHTSNELELGYPSRFQKDSENAAPGYYAVHLDDYNIDVELTTTNRVGIHRYTYNNTDCQGIVLDLLHRDQLIEGYYEMISDTEIIGYRISNAWAEDQRIYFVAQFSEPIVDRSLYRCLDINTLADTIRQVRDQQQGFFRFKNQEVNEVIIKVGVSATSIEGARLNLQTEASHWNFNQYKADAEAAWAKQLGKIEVEGGSKEQRTIFYTSLYHTMIAPNLFSDVDGKYRGMDGKIHQANHDVYTVFSLWDTFRATHPLYTIIEQDRTKDFINTFLLQYEQGGLLPVWELAGNETFCMIGYHSVSVITDAYVKGIRGFDAELALEAMVNSANQNHHGLEAYKRKGFIGAGDESESVSKTLEYAYDDWCIAVFADSLGHDSIANEFYTRSKNWINMFDTETGFMRARMNGGWQPGFKPEEVNFNFTEANSWQYSAFVPHDIETLISKHGGEAMFEQWLDNLFSASSETSGRDQADITGLVGQYAHGNEPSHHMAYLYHFVGKPNKSVNMTHGIMQNLYTDQPDGLSGNEDCGQMSAWYVLSAMGFYPVTPGSNDYVLTSPIFDKVTIHLENGNDFVITTNYDNGTAGIGAIKQDGGSMVRRYIHHSEIADGGSLDFIWSDVISNKEYPPQSAVSVTYHPVPIINAESMSFTDSMLVRITCEEPFTYCRSLNQDDCVKVSNIGSELYSVEFWISEGTNIYAWSSHTMFGNEIIAFPILSREPLPGSWIPARSVTAQFNKIDPNITITLLSEYANQYAAGGDNALIDGIRGPDNFRTGFWQGYQGQDVVAVVDLGQERAISSVQLGVLQDIRSWIWFPESVRFSFSADGENWGNEVVVKNHAHIDSYLVMRNRVTGFKNIQAQFVKVEAINRGPCPDWHLGAGGESWIFVDEIVINTRD